MAEWSSVPPACVLAGRAFVAAHVKKVAVSPQPGVGKDWVMIIVGPNPDS